MFSILVYLIVFFVFRYGSSTSNEDIVRFRFGGSHIPFLHIFLWIFSIFVWFSSFCGRLCLFYWFLISNYLVATLYISTICMIEHLSMVWFSTFYDNSTSHCAILCLSCTLKCWLLILVCWNLVWRHSTWSFDFQFFTKKREKCVKK